MQELSTALAVLRLARGMKQCALADAAGFADLEGDSGLHRESPARGGGVFL